MSRAPARPFLVRLEHAGKVYTSAGRPNVALEAATLDVRPGQVVLLLGPSGSGKTTLLTLLGGLMAPTSGRVLLFGQDVARAAPAALQALRARRVGFVFQTFRLVESLTAAGNVALVLRFAGAGRRQARARAVALLERLGLGHLTHRRPRDLSQGEKQRVAIARALANDAQLLLADEPTANLDSARSHQVAAMLREACARGGRAAVLTSHDERLTAYADVVLRLRDGVLLPGSAPRQGAVAGARKELAC